MSFVKDTVFGWYTSRVRPGFSKAWSYLLTILALVVGVLPDLINMVIENWSMLSDGLPTLTLEHKVYFFVAVKVIQLLVQPIKQQPDSIKIAAPQPEMPPVPNAGGA